ncbi:N-acyl homoserine lactonase [Burkholderia sp. BCC0044]|uniref:N-acyl homoserine lactonase n=1 Tax=Burkholderia sp. BCC0044 TaxID=2676295 RepID=UPI001FC8A4F7|nr:N-acyl homoserine lactonase [Burkholderia sp. BCC0044]
MQNFIYVKQNWRMKLKSFITLTIMVAFLARISLVHAYSGESDSAALVGVGGNKVARQLTDNYNNLAPDCGSATNPAFRCSGVLLRGTVHSSQYHSWNPSPASVASGGVSFSYLRKDSKFSKLAYGYSNGLIFVPYKYNIKPNVIEPEILCSFPIDANTENRVDKGCGADNSFPTDSGPCQARGISTAEEWHSHYNSTSGNRHAHQCGFDVHHGASATSAIFKTSIDAMTLIAEESIHEQNELRLATWEQDIPEKLPIMAFFYLGGHANGLKGAQDDQVDYQQASKRIVPIIRITLPSSRSDEATFVYDKNDQMAVPSQFAKPPVEPIPLVPPIPPA